MTMESKQEQRIIYLAGGCFWGLEAYMERIQGVTDAVSGYANGKGDTTKLSIIACDRSCGNGESHLRSK